MNTVYKIAKKFLFNFTPEQAHHITMANLDWATHLGLQKLLSRPVAEDPIKIMDCAFPTPSDWRPGWIRTVSM